MAYRLTEEGERYAKEGMPEARLARLLDKPLQIKEAEGRMEGFGIALQWAKKRGWVKIEDGMLIRAGQPSKLPEEEALRKLAKGEKVDEKLLDTLLKRKLVEVESAAMKAVEGLRGKEVASLSPELIKTGAWRDVRIKPYNVEAMSRVIYPGKRHPYSQFLAQVRRKLVELGFKEMTGPLIETEFWNFDAMYQPQNHPSRDWTQTYSLKHPQEGSLPAKAIVDKVRAAHENGGGTGSSGWGYKWDPKKASRLMPRAHTTACSARRLAAGVEVPGKYFAIGRNFRPDVIDVTHGVEFNHCEGIVVSPDMHFGHLLGLLKMFASEVAGAEEVRFFPDYYPFTEYSVQLSAKHPKMGWIEFAGAGLFRPEFSQSLGVKGPVLAWGIGIDRLAMFKLKIKDIRNLFTRDLQWLREQAVI